jgi:hypothetical protein
VAVNVSLVPLVRLKDDLLRVTPVTAIGETVKLTLKFAVIPLPPLIVTVAVYVPTASPVMGTTVKVPVSPTAILLIVVVDRVVIDEKLKDPLFVPESAAVNAPVA